MRSKSRAMLVAAVLFGCSWATAARAAAPDHRVGQIPDDVWTGRYGGNPSITVSRYGGSVTVSVVMPAPLLDGTDRQSLTATVKRFLERYGPPMCTDLIDLTVPHKNLVVELGVQDLGWSMFHFNFYEVSRNFGTLSFDYQPAGHTKCVGLRPPTS